MRELSSWNTAPFCPSGFPSLEDAWSHRAHLLFWSVPNKAEQLLQILLALLCSRAAVAWCWRFPHPPFCCSLALAFLKVNQGENCSQSCLEATRGEWRSSANLITAAGGIFLCMQLNLLVASVHLWVSDHSQLGSCCCLFHCERSKLMQAVGTSLRAAAVC